MNHVSMCDIRESVDVNLKGKRKIKCHVDESHFVTVSKRKKRYYVKIKKGKRDISLSPEMWAVICDLKETVLLCCNFLETSSFFFFLKKRPVSVELQETI